MTRNSLESRDMINRLFMEVVLNINIQDTRECICYSSTRSGPSGIMLRPVVEIPNDVSCLLQVGWFCCFVLAPSAKQFHFVFTL
jgi:hypothetical protein